MTTTNRPIRRALVSVFHKEGIEVLAEAFIKAGTEVVSTGSTAKRLAELGVKVTEVSEVTGFPECLDGRVKTLDPHIHAGILADMTNEDHAAQLEKFGIKPFDLVVVNLYPFADTVRSGADEAATIEKIDIGGPSMVRGAAKNSATVAIITDPNDYALVAARIENGEGFSLEERRWLAGKAFAHTAAYDATINEWTAKHWPKPLTVEQPTAEDEPEVNETKFPAAFTRTWDRAHVLRYGENPHQQARFYRGAEPVPFSLAFARQLNGKELSYNNIQDANAALNIVREFDAPFCVGLKHMNPCGAAVGRDIAQAWSKAYEADKVSIYGGIVAVNREVDAATALAMKPVFLEIIIAPSFSKEALEILTKKKNLRLLEVDMRRTGVRERQLVSVNGGLLVQDLDTETCTVTAEMAVTKRRPEAALLADMDFAWRIVKHVKSNAIVVVKDGCTAGIGAGQMNRVGSAEIALREAREKGLTEGLVLASDGFLPFDDTVTLAAGYGVSAIVQPGGSIHDEDSVVKADELGIAMVFTGERHFKH